MTSLEGHFKGKDGAGYDEWRTSVDVPSFVVAGKHVLITFTDSLASTSPLSRKRDNVVNRGSRRGVS